MTLSKEERVRELARLVGIAIAEEEVPEVANRFDALVQELDLLRELDLRGAAPLVVFPDEGEA